MSKYSPTVLPQPVDYGAPLRDAVQAFFMARGIRNQNRRQQQQDQAAAQEQAFNNALRERQIALQEQAAQRQREQQTRENAQAGYTPATDTTIDLGPLGQALAGQAGGAGLTGAVLQQTPVSTLHTPASYDPTQSQAYAVAQAGRDATAGYNTARLAETNRHNVAMEGAAMMRARRPLGGAGSPGADVRAANQKEQYFQNVADDAVQGAAQTLKAWQQADPRTLTPTQRNVLQIAQAHGPQEAIAQLATLSVSSNPQTAALFSHGMDARHIMAAVQAFGERPATRGKQSMTTAEKLQALHGMAGDTSTMRAPVIRAPLPSTRGGAGPAGPSQVFAPPESPISSPTPPSGVQQIVGEAVNRIRAGRGTLDQARQALPPALYQLVADSLNASAR